jgi:hypothetical protein
LDDAAGEEDDPAPLLLLLLLLLLPLLLVVLLQAARPTMVVTAHPAASIRFSRIGPSPCRVAVGAALVAARAGDE